MDTITVNGIEYEVERSSDHDGNDIFTIEQFPGLVGKLESEDCIESWMNPRDCDGNLGVMMASYRNYILGGAKHDTNDVPRFEIPCEKCEVATDECGECDRDGMIPTDPATWARVTHGAKVVLPLFIYEHGGITMFTGSPIFNDEAMPADFNSRNRSPMDSDGWDTSAVGIYFDTAETRKECGWEDRSPEDIAKDMEGEIKLYDQYLRGQVYIYNVEDTESDYDNSCGGLVGDADYYVKHELLPSMGRAIEARLREQLNRADAAARDIVTI